MNDLSGLINRLENATSRLESLASSSKGETTIKNHESANQNVSLTDIKPRSDIRSERSQSVVNYDDIVHGCINPFLELSSKLDVVVNKQVLALIKAFEAMKQFLKLTTLSKRPEPNSKAYVGIFEDLQREIGAVNEIRESHRSSPLIEHLSMVGEGVGALGWITIEPNPAEYAAEFMNGAKLYGNRILKQYRDKESINTQWVQAFYTLCQSLVQYIKTTYPKGISWNKDGLDPAEALCQIKGANQTSKDKKAIPSPPPMPINRSLHVDNKGVTGPTMRDVFKEINKGEIITSTLKKADGRLDRPKDQARSEGDRSQSGLGSKYSETKDHKQSKDVNISNKPSRKHMLDGNRWIIEYYNHPKQPIEVSPEIRQSVLISHCQDASIIISGKATAVSVDNCSKLKLRLDSLVASMEAIKVNNLSLEITGTVSSILLDQVDIGNVFVSKRSENIEIYTSKTTGVNINYEDSSTESGSSSKEFLIPEQIKSYFRDGKLKAEAVEYLD